MTGLEPLLIPALSALAGWFARHYGIFAPANASPQTPPGAGGTSPLGPVQADLPSMIESIVGAVVKKEIARLESMLSPSQPATVKPQT